MDVYRWESDVPRDELLSRIENAEITTCYTKVGRDRQFAVWYFRSHVRFYGSVEQAENKTVIVACRKTTPLMKLATILATAAFLAGAYVQGVSIGNTRIAFALLAFAFALPLIIFIEKFMTRKYAELDLIDAAAEVGHTVEKR